MLWWCLVFGGGFVAGAAAASIAVGVYVGLIRVWARDLASKCEAALAEETAVRRAEEVYMNSIVAFMSAHWKAQVIDMTNCIASLRRASGRMCDENGRYLDGAALSEFVIGATDETLKRVLKRDEEFNRAVEEKVKDGRLQIRRITAGGAEGEHGAQ